MTYTNKEKSSALRSSIQNGTFTRCVVPKNNDNLNSAISNCFQLQNNTLPLVIILPEGLNVSVGASISGKSNFAILFDGPVNFETYLQHQPSFLSLTSCSNFLIMSSKVKVGGVHGQGYHVPANVRSSTPCLIRVESSENFAIAGIALIDSPKFLLVLGGVKNAEITTLLIQRQPHGATDGIDVSGENIFIHDVEVSNRDECVTVKSPAKNVYIKNILCNISGGCAMGSLGPGTSISDILYENIYSCNTNQGYMIKSYKGDGKVSGITLNNFILSETAYGFQLTTEWEYPGLPNSVKHENIYLNNWNGSIYHDPAKNRPAIQATCRSNAPCKNIVVNNFNVKTGGPQLLLQHESHKFTNVFTKYYTGPLFTSKEWQESEYDNIVGPKKFPKGIRNVFFPKQEYRNYYTH